MLRWGQGLVEAKEANQIRGLGGCYIADTPSQEEEPRKGEKTFRPWEDPYLGRHPGSLEAVTEMREVGQVWNWSRAGTGK